LQAIYERTIQVGRWCLKSQICAKKAKTFTQRRKGAEISQRKTLRILCVSASLRALLFLVAVYPRCAWPCMMRAPISLPNTDTAPINSHTRSTFSLRRGLSR
jgi:hypothetical protein